jgi:hypothetical protein
MQWRAEGRHVVARKGARAGAQRELLSARRHARKKIFVRNAAGNRSFRVSAFLTGKKDELSGARYPI